MPHDDRDPLLPFTHAWALRGLHFHSWISPTIYAYFCFAQLGKEHAKRMEDQFFIL